MKSDGAGNRIEIRSSGNGRSKITDEFDFSKGAFAVGRSSSDSEESSEAGIFDGESVPASVSVGVNCVEGRVRGSSVKKASLNNSAA